MDHRVTIPGLVVTDGVARFNLDPHRVVPLLDEITLERLRLCLQAVSRADARVLVITGGTRGVFAAGADLARLAMLDSATALAFSRKGQELFDRFQTGDFVSIAMVSGRCIGGAFDLAMACDLRVADTTATFSHPGPLLGFITGYGGTGRLPALAGRAARAVLTGRRTLDAVEALALGLVAEATPPELLDRTCAEIARRIAEVPATRIRCIKEVLVRLSCSTNRRRLEGALCRLAASAGGTGTALE